MSCPADKININLNQNIWGLVASYSLPGASEYYKLCALYWFTPSESP